MGKKDTELTSKKRKTASERTPFIDQRTRAIFGLALLLLSIYTLFAMVCFFFSGGIDQSLVDKGLRTIVTNISLQSDSPAGKFGAWLSDLLINRWFGLASFILCYLLIILSLRIIGKDITRFARKIFLSLVLMLWFSVCADYFSELIYAAIGTQRIYLYLGGAHGYFVNLWLSSLVGQVGTFFIILLSATAILFFGFEPTFYKCVELVKKMFAKTEEVLPDVISEKDESNENESDATMGKRDGSSENEGDTAMGKKDDDGYREVDENVVGDIYAGVDENDEHFIYESDRRNANGVSVESDERDEPEELMSFSTGQTNDIQLVVTASRPAETVSQNKPIGNYDPTLDLSNYKYPPLDLLEERVSGKSKVTDEELEANKNRIVGSLKNFKIDITKIKATIGPTVTLYEIVPAPGVKISQIKNLEDDIALSLSALGIRIIAPIPGKGTIGIEVPNQHPETVSMRSILSEKKFQEMNEGLPITIGRTISNETYTFDLTKMPHLLVAGATGQGKSVGLNAIITSLLYKKHPSQLKLVLVDPKKVELSIYAIIEKHFLAKLPDEEEAIITENEKVVNTLNSLCIEMDTRYDLLKQAGVNKIKDYNDKFIKRQLNPEKGHRYLPFIVVIVDEFSDLIMTAGKEVEKPIIRIAQLARAVGIHMIIATQRPDVKVITGLIKANFPARIAFKVSSMMDSRTILDASGANQLIGRGDMLISVNSEMTRVQCAFVDTPEIEKLTKYIASQQGYATAFDLPEYHADGEGDGNEVDLGAKDPLFEDAARLVVNSQQGSTSAIQRRFSIGYNRAGRIIDQLAAAGIIGPFEGSKARQVLIMDENSLEGLLRSLE
ncbi:DNA translocase FtsK [Bacteroidia bacterium]|nr:DNA translocase FtsK [Bacteroidia bacterium]